MIEAATRRAYGELAGLLRPFIARRVPDVEVDDVLQEVFLRVESAVQALRDEERFGPWIYRVARNAIVDSHRRRARQPLLSAEIDPSIDSVDEEACGPSALEAELAGYVVGVVAELPSPYREALTLTELQGLTQQAAADALGISLSAMKSRVQRGREKLRELVEACCRISVDARGHVIECEPRQKATCSCKSS
jgi:RNA polymerase sigma-70 factor, ECF subfamily